MNFSDINKIDLDNLNLEIYAKNIASIEYQKYFLSKSGVEHYRLLSHISSTNNNINIVDIGTFKGCSALAFSVNKSNTVYTFNLIDQLDLIDYPNNIKFIVDDILKEKYKDIILNSQYILLDTYHNGIFEKIFYDYLISINYKGFLLLDDIYLNIEMKKFWSLIHKNKYDITNIGHITGTGVVCL